MFLKWVEYKIICDKCSQDIIGWNGHESRADAILEYKRMFRSNPINGRTICKDCKNIENEKMVLNEPVSDDSKKA